MATAGTLIVRMLARTEQFRKEMEESRKQLEKTADAAAGASTAIAAMLAAVGVAAIVAGGAAVKMAAQWEQTEIAFTTLLKSGEKAKAFLEDLDRFAAVTPFELPGLVDASRKLLAFGFQAEDIIPIMTHVGDAVAALGGGAFEIDRVTRALGQMYAKGKVTSQEMSLQLAELGIPAWRYLAEAIGTDVPGAMKKVERGMIPASVGIQAILHGMAKEFGGAMEVQSKTMIGLWSTAKDQIGMISRATGQYLIEAFNIKGLVEGLGKALGGLADEIRRAASPAEGIRNILANTFTPKMRLAVIGLAGAVAGMLAPAFILAAKAIWGAFLTLAPFMIKGAAVALAAYVIYRAWADAGGGMMAVGVLMVRMVGAVVGVLGLIIPSLRTVSQSIYAYADSLAAASRATRTAVQPATQGMGDLHTATAQMVKSGQDAAAAQEALGDATENAAKAAGKNIMAFDQVHQLQEDMAGMGAAAADAMELVLPDVPTFISPDVTAVVGPLDELAKKWDAVTVALERAKPVLETIGYIITGVLVVKTLQLIYKLGLLAVTSLITAGKVVAAWAMKAAAAVASTAVQVGKFVLLIGKWIVLGVTAMTNAGKIVFAWLMQLAPAAATAAATVIAAAVIVGKWTAMAAAAIAKAAVMAAAWFIALGPVGWVIGVIVALAALIIWKWDEIKAFTIDTWTTVSNWLAQTWDKIKAWAGEKWAGIKTAVETPIRTVITWLGTQWNTISGTLSRIWDGIKTSAATAWAGILDAIKSRIDPLIDLINRLIDAANKLPLINIPTVKTTSVAAPAVKAAVSPVAKAVTAPATGQAAKTISAGARAVRGTIRPLAKGTNYVPENMFAFLHKGEAVVPEKFNPAPDNQDADAIYRAVYAAMRDAIKVSRVEQGGQDQRQEVVLEIDGNKIGRAILPTLIREGQRLGIQLVGV